MIKVVYRKLKEIKKKNKKKKFKAYGVLGLSLLIISFSLPSYAKNLGKVGQVYPIKEVDMLDFIQSRLSQMKQNGKLDKINKKMRETAKKRADRPLPVKKISPTKTYRKWFIDPSVTFKQEITDTEGRVIVKAGTTVNPLKQVSLRTALIFFNGDDKSQVLWVKKKNKFLNEKNKKSKLILVNGSISKQMKSFGRIYFDQHGKLVNKFKIEHTPAIVTQEGLQFKIEEFVS